MKTERRHQHPQHYPCMNKRPSLLPALHQNLLLSSIPVVDDDTQVLDVMSEMLRLEGHNFSIAENGQQAVNQKRDAQFDLVITDLGVFELDKAGGGGMTLVEVADGVTLDQIAESTEAAYSVAPGL